MNCQMQIDNNANTTIRIEKSKEDTFIGAQCMGLKKNPFENDISSITYIEKNLQDYLVCAKSDGVRYLMYLMKSGKVLFWGRNNDIFDVP